LKFLIDNCLSPKYAQILGFLTIGDVIALREEFPANAADPVWIKEIGLKGWALVSVDRNQLRTEAEKKAISAGGAIGIYLNKKFNHMLLSEQAWRLMKAWPAIVKVASSAIKGSCYLVSENGKVEKTTLK
jgi:PIN like domain